MIRVLLLGRTGNNLFQYAFGRVLAKRHGVPLVMDGSLFNRSHWVGVSRLRDRPLETTVERKNPFPSRLVKKLSERHPRELFPVRTLREHLTDQRHDPALAHNSQPDSLVIGYFQPPLYFAGIESELREEICLSHLPWPSVTEELADHIGGDASSRLMLLQLSHPFR